jgi:hypothetical protein
MSAWKKIVDYTVPSNTTSVVLDNFGTITKDDFISIRVDHNAITAAINLRVLANNSVNANYHTQILRGIGSTVNAGRFNASVFNETSLNKTSTTFMYLKLSENDRANFFCNTNRENDSEVMVLFHYITSSGATFANGITSLTFTREDNVFIGANSRIQIYRLAAEKVADITVTSNTTQVDITGLDIEKESEYLLVSNITNNISADLFLNAFINNNTTATNYYAQTIAASGTSLGAGRLNNANIAIYRGATAPNLLYTYFKLSNIGVYTAQSYNIIFKGNSGIEIWNTFVSSVAESITNINQFNLISTGTNGIGTGTRFELYKLY